MQEEGYQLVKRQQRESGQKMKPAANKWASTAIPWSLNSDYSLQEAASHLMETF